MIVGLEGLVPTSRLAGDLAALGQDLAEPPTSAGCRGHCVDQPGDARRPCESRLRVAVRGRIYGAGLDARKPARAHGCDSPAAAGRWLFDLLIQGDLPGPAERLVLESAPTGTSDSLRGMAQMIVTLPEFQLAEETQHHERSSQPCAVLKSILGGSSLLAFSPTIPVFLGRTARRGAARPPGHRPRDRPACRR